jgi:hypothetical protein
VFCSQAGSATAASSGGSMHCRVSVPMRRREGLKSYRCPKDIAPCRAAGEEYDLCQGSRGFDCSALCCPRFLDLRRFSIYIGGLPSPSVDPFHFDTGRSACVEALLLH